MTGNPWLIVLSLALLLAALLVLLILRRRASNREPAMAIILKIYRDVLRHDVLEDDLHRLEATIAAGSQPAEAFLGLALLYESRGLHERAADLFRSVFIRPDAAPEQAADAAAGYLRTLLAGGRTRLAADEALSLARRFSSSPAFLRATLWCFQADGRWDDAALLPKRIEKLEKRPVPMVWYRYHMAHGAWLAANGKTGPALTHYRKAQTLAPQLPKATLAVVRLHLAANAPDKAVKALTGAMEAAEPASQAEVGKLITILADKGETLALEDMLRGIMHTTSQPEWVRLLLVELLISQRREGDAMAVLAEEAWPEDLAPHLVNRLITAALRLGEMEFINRILLPDRAR
ncbi:hypothetical protein JW905_07240 [bacterium]|nr:hypothetical protein [candidate division CSSED10-310 bacterium]